MSTTDETPQTHPNLDNEMVRVFDAKDGTSRLMPARELSQYMVQIVVSNPDGSEEVGWADSRDIQVIPQTGPPPREPFDEPTCNLIREIQVALAEHYAMSVDEWEDGFRRDAVPEREIAVWLHIARLYRFLTEAPPRTQAEREDTIQILVACLNAPRPHVLTIAPRQVLSEEQALKIIGAFYGDKSTT